MAEIKDSGNRTVFSTGSVRDIQEDKGRCDLLPLGVIAGFIDDIYCDGSVIGSIYKFMCRGECTFLYEAVESFVRAEGKSMPEFLLDLSMHYKQGAEKYGERNWEKGIPLHSYIDSGVRHFLKYIDGQTDERHDRAFVWNMLGAIWTMEHRPEMIDIPFEMLGGRDA